MVDVTDSCSGGASGWRTGVTTALGVLVAAISSMAMAGTITVGPSWTAQGPGPFRDVFSVVIPPDNEASGAVHTVLADPTDADILYVGGVNGGIWKTTNAKDTRPHWTQLTGHLPSPSIGAMEYDPTDLNHETIIAGIGRFSNYGGEGGRLSGLLLTTDGGSSFAELDAPVLQGRNISGVAKRGSVILAAATNINSTRHGGVYRSVDTGGTWASVSGLTGPAVAIANVVPGTPVTIESPDHGLRRQEAINEDRLVVERALPEYVLVAGVNGTAGANGIFRVTVGDADSFTLDGSSDMQAYSGGGTWTKLPSAFDLVGDPGAAGRFYVSIEGTGIFRSDDTGATWRNVSAGDATLNAAITDGCRPPGPPAPDNGCPNFNIEMAVSPIAGRLYVSVLENNTQPTYVGFTDDGGTNWTQMDSGNLEGSATKWSIAADPTQQDIVYLGGTRSLARGDAGEPRGSQWTSLVHGGTASGTAPHHDSREMVFDVNGDMIEVSDGGVYRRTSPRFSTGDWESVNGDLLVAEISSIAYDTVSNVIIAGTQDNGTAQQPASGSRTWDNVTCCDGGDVAVVANHPSAGQSTRYSSWQNLGGFNRRVYDSSNALVVPNPNPNPPSLIGLPFPRQGYPAVVVNAVNPSRLAIGNQGVYESFDEGVTVQQVIGAPYVNDRYGRPLAYGGMLNGVPNPEVLVTASIFDQVYVRSTPTASIFPTPAAFPGHFIIDLVLDSDDWRRIFVATPDEVYMTTDAGASWENVTGNLDTVNNDLRSIEFIPSPTVDAVVVGGLGGVSRMQLDAPGGWQRLGSGIGNGPVWDMDYDPEDDVLVAGTLGRSAWSLTPVATIVQPLVISRAPPNRPDLDGDALHYDGRAGAFVGEFGNGCNPVDLVYGPDDRLYVADTDHPAFGGCDPANIVTRFDGRTGDFEEFDDPHANFVPLPDPRFAFGPGGLTFGPDGNLYVSDPEDDSVHRYQGPLGANPGQFMDTFVPSGRGGLVEPTKVLFGPDNSLYVISRQTDSILRYEGPLHSSPGAFVDAYVSSGSGGLDVPADLAFGPDDRLYVASFGTDEVLLYQGPSEASPGEFISEFIALPLSPVSLAFGSSRDLFVTGSVFAGGGFSGVQRYDGQTGSYKGNFAFVRDPGQLIFSHVPEFPEGLGDFNEDGCVDQSDLRFELLPAIRGRSSDPRFDLNGDGRDSGLSVNMTDARKLVLLFDQPRGAPCP